MWCCPSAPLGNGLKYPVVEADGKWFELYQDRRAGEEEEDAGHQA